jgi:hypothetical protein
MSRAQYSKSLLHFEELEFGLSVVLKTVRGKEGGHAPALRRAAPVIKELNASLPVELR